MPGTRIIYEETSQTVYFLPPSAATGTPTYVIERLDKTTDDSDRAIASGSATVDSTSLTTTAAAGPGEAMAAKIPMTTTGGAVGDVLEIVSVDGETELFTVGAIVSNTYLVAEQPLMGTYATGSTVRGLEFSAAFPDATAGDEEYLTGASGPVRVLWQYVLGGKTLHAQDLVEIVRVHDGDVDEAAAVLLLRDAFPDIPARIDGAYPGRLAQWATYCANDLRRKLITRGDDPAKYLMGEQGTHALMWRLVEHASVNGITPGNLEPAQWIIDARKEFAAVWHGLTSGEAGKETADLTPHEDTIAAKPSRKGRGPVFAP